VVVVVAVVVAVVVVVVWVGARSMVLAAAVAVAVAVTGPVVVVVVVLDTGVEETWVTEGGAAGIGVTEGGLATEARVTEGGLTEAMLGVATEGGTAGRWVAVVGLGEAWVIEADVGETGGASCEDIEVVDVAESCTTDVDIDV
jgi:hypothetical protein